MKSFKFFKKNIFFSVICNNIIFGADKSEDDGIVLTKENIGCVDFDAKINESQVYKNCGSYFRLTQIPKFLRVYIENIIKNEKTFKCVYNDGYSIPFFRYFKIVYNVFSNDVLIKDFKQDQTLLKNRDYRLLQEIVFPAVIHDGYNKISYYNFDFLDEEFYDNILNKNYFTKVKFKDGTLYIDVDLDELLKIIQRRFILSNGKGITVPFGIHEDSFNAAEKKFSVAKFSESAGFDKFYCETIYDYDDMSRFEEYFNFKIRNKVVPVLNDSGKYIINIDKTISEVNCKSGQFNGELYPDLYYFYSRTICNFEEIEKLLENNTNSYKWFFEKNINEDNFKKLLEDETLFHFYKVIESIDLNRIKDYSVFFQNIVYFIKNYVIPYEKQLLFNELEKIAFKEYLNAKESNAEEFFYNKAYGIIKSEDSVFQKFYTLFFYDEANKRIRGVYFDDLNKKDELDINIVKLFSLEKLINEFENKYIEINSVVNETLKENYDTINDNKSLKEQFLKIIKDKNIIQKDFEDDFLKSKNFSFPISEYITLYCKEKIYKNELWSKDKKTLKIFIKKLNKKDNLFNEIKEKTNALNINEYYTYFYNNKLDDLFNYMKNHSLNSLSEIFANEVINEQKEEIDKVSDNVKNLKEKKTYYNNTDKVEDKDILSNIVALLNTKKESENMNDVIFSDYYIGNVLRGLNEYINKKVEDKKNKIITAFVDKQKAVVKDLKELTACTEYLDKFNKDKNIAGSIKQLLKDELKTAGFEDVDIKDDDYNLADLRKDINDKKIEIEASLTAKIVKEDQDELANIKSKIKEIVNKIIIDIKAINSKDSLKNFICKNDDSIIDMITSELKLNLPNYDDFIKKEIPGLDPKQTFENIINLDIKTNVTNILAEYKKIEDSLYIVNINYTLSDEDKITDEGKNEFNKLTDEKYKKFDSRKKYKDLYNLLKSVSLYFKNIELVDSSTLTSIENNKNVIEKDNITINIKLVDSCYKKDEPKEEHEEDKNKDKYNEEDREHKDDNENNDKIKEEDIEDSKKGVKNNRCCGCYNNKNNKNSYCVKKKFK